ncbi:MAG: anhydro-N-acetylmuramic acid kinase, partial [Bacteroidales bacterium]|nr:anhydro-N-acetylmuramic acid kinase [Bacteroidales bacterium]
TSLSNRDKMRTVAEHIAIQISKGIIESGLTGKVLMTGGGVYNSFIISRIKELCPDHQIIIPEKKIIDFKEALIFAFLGLLRYLNIPNCLSSYTGANADICAGSIYDGRLNF